MSSKAKKRRPSAHLKSQGLSKSLTSIHKGLSGPEKRFSRFIHRRGIELISDAIEATIARPSGLLAGGTLAFIASTWLMIICRFYGYEYNYLIGVAAFVAGFFLGLIIELILKLVRRF